MVYSVFGALIVAYRKLFGVNAALSAQTDAMILPRGSSCLAKGDFKGP